MTGRTETSDEKTAAHAPRILLVNPPAYDFSAFDLWLRPLGLLRIGTILQMSGMHVRLLDALDRDNPAYAAHGLAPGPERKNSSGPFFATGLKPPSPLRKIPRYFYRFGMPEDLFRHEADRIRDAGFYPDYILVAALFTYWHLGVIAAVRELREVFPKARFVLGGIYPTLLEKHARAHVECDEIRPGPADEWLRNFIAESGLELNAGELFVNLDLYDHPVRHAPILTAVGCPYNCEYCASRLVSGGYAPRPALAAIRDYWDVAARGIADAAIFDDAFLVDAQNRALPFLREAADLRTGPRLHFPNGLHVKLIDDEIAELMKLARTATVRLSFETVREESFASSSFKATGADFKRAVTALKKAGFAAHELGTYVLFGAPGQTAAEIVETFEFIHGCGAKIYPAIFSPVPKTPVFAKAVAAGMDPNEPLFQNKTAFAHLFGPFPIDEFAKLRDMARKLNRRLRVAAD